MLVHALWRDLQLVVVPKYVLALALWVRSCLTEEPDKLRRLNYFAQPIGAPLEVVSERSERVLLRAPEPGSDKTSAWLD